MSTLHSALAAGQIHVPYQWSYADATARAAATGFVAGDVGKLARQVSDNSLWMLTDDSPITWQQVGIVPTTPAMVLIAEHTTAAGGEADYTFSGIPGTYKELLLVWQARCDNAAAQSLLAQFNADTGNNYYQDSLALVNTTMTGYPAVAQPNVAIGTVTGTGAPAGSAGAGQVTIPKYSKTVFHKQFVAQDYRSDSNVNAGQALYSRGGRWANTAAITAIKLFLSAGNFIEGCTFALYGLG